MDLDVYEENGKTVISPSERSHTLMTVLKQAIWDAGGKAGYNRGHPYEGDTGELVLESDAPADTLDEAISMVQDELEAFQDTFESATA